MVYKVVNQKTTVEQTAEDCEAISQATHTCMGVNAAKGDVKLHYQNDQEGAFYVCCIQAYLLALWSVTLREGTVCSEILDEIHY